MFKPLIDSCPSVIPVDYDEDLKIYQTLIDVAKCEVTQRVVSVFCELAHSRNFQPVPANLWFHEFSFHIYVRSIDSSDLSIFTQDREIARNYFPNIIIPLIMKIVIRSCSVLVKEAKPTAIYRVTKIILPNKKAMLKHDLVTSCLYDLGYALLETGVDRFGRTYWAMTRE